ncbi:Peptidase M24 [Burkholderia cenocepacia PC184]|nr:Peptidase M24 [Burkholderia cenocepacia PC184]
MRSGARARREARHEHDDLAGDGRLAARAREPARAGRLRRAADQRRAAQPAVRADAGRVARLDEPRRARDRPGDLAAGLERRAADLRDPGSDDRPERRAEPRRAESPARRAYRRGRRQDRVLHLRVGRSRVSAEQPRLSHPECVVAPRLPVRGRRAGGFCSSRKARPWDVATYGIRLSRCRPHVNAFKPPWRSTPSSACLRFRFGELRARRRGEAGVAARAACRFQPGRGDAGEQDAGGARPVPRRVRAQLRGDRRDDALGEDRRTGRAPHRVRPRAQDQRRVRRTLGGRAVVSVDRGERREQRVRALHGGERRRRADRRRTRAARQRRVLRSRLRDGLHARRAAPHAAGHGRAAVAARDLHGRAEGLHQGARHALSGECDGRRRRCAGAAGVSRPWPRFRPRHRARRRDSRARGRRAVRAGRDVRAGAECGDFGRAGHLPAGQGRRADREHRDRAGGRRAARHRDVREHRDGRLRLGPDRSGSAGRR